MKVYTEYLRTMGYVGWGDKQRYLVTDLNLGFGVRCKHRHGVRRMVWDAAFGYVNGFRKRDILYYLVTRSMSKRIMHKVLDRNEARGLYQETTFMTFDEKSNYWQNVIQN